MSEFMEIVPRPLQQQGLAGCSTCETALVIGVRASQPFSRSHRLFAKCPGRMSGCVAFGVSNLTSGSSDNCLHPDIFICMRAIMATGWA